MQVGAVEALMLHAGISGIFGSLQGTDWNKNVTVHLASCCGSDKHLGFYKPLGLSTV